MTASADEAYCQLLSLSQESANRTYILKI